MANAQHFVMDIPVGGNFDGYLLVKDANQNTATNGSEYLRTTLGDKSGELTAMIWNVQFHTNAVNVFQPGNVIRAAGNIIEYNGAKQINLTSSTQVDNPDESIMAQLVKTAPINTDAVFREIMADIEAMNNETIKNITGEILESHKAQFTRWPAAKKLHHAYRGGLIYHTDNMRQLANMVCLLNPDLNRDLLIAGVILHDVGKIYEYTEGDAIEFTLHGQLKGHITIVSEMIAQTAKQLHIPTNPSTPEGEAVLLLQHMVLTHHGPASNGWGSSVSPQIIEADVLHRIDMMDSKLESYREASANTEDKAFTEPIFSLGNTRFYKHNL